MSEEDNILNKLYGTGRANDIKNLYQPMPSPSKPIITLQDVDSKFVERYFVQLVTEKNMIVEVSKGDFSDFKNNPRFVTAVIKWRIVGKKETVTRPGNVKIFGVEDLNRNAVMKADLTMKGLRYYFKDYTEYWYGEQYK